MEISLKYSFSIGKRRMLTYTIKLLFSFFLNYLFTPLTICVLNSYIFHFKYNYRFPDVLALHDTTRRRK